jgi:hypothetical protein
MAALIIFFCFVVWQFLRSSLIDVLRISFNSVVLALLCFRFVKVIRKPTALDAVVTSRLLKTLRALAIFFMWVGVIAMVSFFFIKPITFAIFSGSSEPGLGMLPVLMYIGMAAILGAVGIFLFEITRFVGHFANGGSRSVLRRGEND